MGVVLHDAKREKRQERNFEPLGDPPEYSPKNSSWVTQKKFRTKTQNSSSLKFFKKMNRQSDCFLTDVNFN